MKKVLCSLLALVLAAALAACSPMPGKEESRALIDEFLADLSQQKDEEAAALFCSESQAEPGDILQLRTYLAGTGMDLSQGLSVEAYTGVHVTYTPLRTFLHYSFTAVCGEYSVPFTVTLTKKGSTLFLYQVSISSSGSQITV